MTARQFFELVTEMRKHQKEYYRTRSMSELSISRQIEKRVDSEIERVHAVLNMKPEEKRLFK